LVTRHNDVLPSRKMIASAKTRSLPGMFKPLLRNMLDVDVPNHTRLRGLVQKIGPRISAAP
jgi:cytochrome P450